MTIIRIKKILAVASGVLFCLFGILALPAEAADTIETGLIGAPNAVGWPWYIGLHKGFFTEQQISLDVIYVPTASGLVQQLAAGSLDIVGDVGVVEPIHAVEKGAPVALLRIIGQVSAYEMLAKASISSVKDLKGKIICIGGLSDINRVYLDRIMRANGFKDGDYDMTVVGNTAGRFAALKSGAVDATMLAPPVNFFAEDAGFRNIGMISGLCRRHAVFRNRCIARLCQQTSRGACAKLLAALDKSVAWFNDTSNRAEAVDILVQEMKSPRDPVERSYDYLRKINYFSPNNEISRSRMQNLINAMKGLGDIKSDITVDKIVAPGLTRLVD